jgi:hypothetical protein
MRRRVRAPASLDVCYCAKILMIGSHTSGEVSRLGAQSGHICTIHGQLIR